MRKRYAANLFLGKPAAPPPTVADVATLVVDWAMRDNAKDSAAVARLVSPGGNVARHSCAGGDVIESCGATLKDVGYWGLRFAHPDVAEPGVTWTTEITVAHDPGAARTGFSCINSVGSSTGLVAPTQRQASRPRIVRDVVAKWGGHRGPELSAAPVILDTGDLDGFAADLLDTARVRPAVFVSTRNRDDRPVVDAAKLADWLVGIAHVYVARDRFVSLQMTKKIPQALSCWDGAVRVYWPGFTPGDEQYRHRFWRADEVEEIEQRYQKGFKEFLLGWVSEIAVYSRDPAVPSWDDLDSIRRQRLIEEARAAGTQDELLRLADEELRDKDRRLEEFQLQVQLLGEEVQSERAKKESYKQAYLEALKAKGDTAAPAAVEVVPLDSVAEAIDRAEAQFGDEIVFALNGQSDGRRSPFEKPEEVFNVLKFLASTYYQARTGKVSCPDLGHAVREATGWRYEPHQSDSTMKSRPNWYSTSWDGQTYWLAEHVKTGSSKDPRRTIRIAFAWDAKRNRVVVGFLGQHQETDAT